MSEETWLIMDIMSSLRKKDRSKYLRELLYQDFTKNNYNALKEFKSTPEQYQEYLKEQKRTIDRANKIFGSFSDQCDPKAETLK